MTGKGLYMFLLACGGLGISHTASAQSVQKSLDMVGVISKGNDRDPTKNWEFTAVFSAEPSFGKPLPYDPDADDLLDESEYALKVGVKRAFDRYTIKLDGGATMSPHVLDDGDRESAFFGQFALETQDMFALARADGRSISNGGNDSTIGYFRYKLEQPFSGIFETNTALIHKFTLGLALTDYLFVWCQAGETPHRRPSDPATTLEGCTGKGSIGYKIAAEIAQQVSANDDNEKLSPKLSAEFYFPNRIGLDFGLELVAQLDRYDHALGIDGDKRLDKNLSAKLLFKPDRWLYRHGWSDALELNFGVEYRRRWSNADGKSYERGFFLPSLTISAPLH